jgi:cytochrome c2
VTRSSLFVITVALGLSCKSPAPAADRGDAAPASTGSVASADAAPAGAKLDAKLAFRRDGEDVASLTLAEMLSRVPAARFTAFDPYYARDKSWHAVPIAAVVRSVFGAGAALDDLDFVLVAADGYTIPLVGSKLLEPGGYIAFADADVPAWEPIGPQHAHPGPFYVVWRKDSQRSLETHPRPWQLVSIEIKPFETAYPHTFPRGASASASRGFRTFRAICIHCHAMNREGGRVGPELNVPQSIVEYRPEPQIRAYIRDPKTFRYGNMPAHPNLTDADLDDLISYFKAMKAQKHDTGS